MTYTFCFAAGVGMAAGGIIYMICELTGKWFGINKLVKKLGLQKTRSPDRYQLLLGAGGLSGFILGSLLTQGTSYMYFAGMCTAGLGVVSIEAVKRLITKKKLARKKQECNLLFESIELFMRTGIPMHRALADCLSLTSALTPAINKTLAYWPTGSTKALEVLRKEIDLPEGDILVSLLKQFNQAGLEYFDGILQREAQRLEQLRQASEQISIAKQPIILTVYRALPMVVVLGTFVGALFIRALTNMPFLKGGI